MAEAALNRTVPPQAELPVTAYPHHHHIFQSPAGGVATGLLFDSKSYAVMAISQEPESQTPDVNVDKDGDRVLVLLDGDLALQIGEKRFKMQAGDAVQIPRGVAFGRSGSQAGAHLLLIRAKAFRSFTMYR